MSAKAAFKKLHPGAVAEKHRTNSLYSRSRVYWLVRLKRGDAMWFADGDTEAKAWQAAMAKLEEKP